MARRSFDPKWRAKLHGKKWIMLEGDQAKHRLSRGRSILVPEAVYQRWQSRQAFGKGPAIHIFKPMWFHDITDRPLWIESKQELREACVKHNVRAARLM